MLNSTKKETIADLKGINNMDTNGCSRDKWLLKSKWSLHRVDIIGCYGDYSGCYGDYWLRWRLYSGYYGGYYLGGRSTGEAAAAQYAGD